MTESEFWMFLGKLMYLEKSDEFSEIITRIINLLDSADNEDFFGTEGWRRDFGWEQ
jgi:hypothetical protein